MPKQPTETPVIWRKGKLTYLRPLEIADAPIIYRVINHPETNQYLATHGPKGIGFEEEWIKSKQTPNLTDITVAICLNGGNTMIGTMGLHNIDLINRVATTGSVIFKQHHRNCGYGTDAKMPLLNYAFNSLGLYKVCSSVIAFNGRSVAYSKKCGYIEEGRKRAQWFRDGERHDDVILAVFETPGFHCGNSTTRVPRGSRWPGAFARRAFSLPTPAVASVLSCTPHEPHPTVPHWPQ